MKGGVCEVGVFDGGGFVYVFEGIEGGFMDVVKFG